MRHNHYMYVCILILVLTVSTALAGVPALMSYQGRLADSDGNPVNTTADLTFVIYADNVGTITLWTETHEDVVVEDGLFSVTLGQFTSFGPTVFTGDIRYIGVRIGTGAISTPLTAVVSTAYSLRSTRSDTASYAYSSPGGGTSGWTDDGTTVRLTNINDSVGIGTSNPRVPLEVEGSVTAIIGHSLGTGTAIGVLGSNDNAGIGVMGTSNNGVGVHGISIDGFGGYFYGPKNYFSSNLGVGTETPEEMLHVYRNSSGANAFLKIQSAHATNWGEAGLRIETPQNRWHLRMDDDLNGQIPSGALGLRSNSGGEVMTWRENGRVGIGTTSPNYPLEIVSSDNALRSRSTGGGIGLYTSSSSGFGVYSDAPENFMGGLTGFGQTNPTHRITVNGAIGIQESGTTRYHINYYNNGLNISETSIADYRLYIEKGGDVGIGTSNPQQKLHVNGNARVDGTLMVDNFEEDAITVTNILNETGIAASGATNFVDLGTGYAAYLTDGIAVPAPGYVLAIGQATVNVDHGSIGLSKLEMGISTDPSSLSSGAESLWQLSSAADAGYYLATVPTHRLFSVSSAGTYTYYLVAKRHSDNTMEIYIRKMFLIYIPTAYGSKMMEALVNTNTTVGDESNAETVFAESALVRSVLAENNEDQKLAELAAEIEAIKRRLNELDGD